MTWNIEEFITMLCSRKHKNNDVRYLLLNYFNNKINFLFSCEIRSWSLHFRQFDICQANTAQSSTLVHSIVPNKWAKFGAKIFGHFWDIAICLCWGILFCLTLYNIWWYDNWIWQTSIKNQLLVCGCGVAHVHLMSYTTTTTTTTTTTKNNR